VNRRLALLAAAGALAAAAAASAADAPTRDVGMPGKLFDPAHITVLTGTTVTWRNGDSINHTVTADGDAFDSGYVAPGGSFSTTFAREGHYAYHCQIHKFMKGTVDVYSLVLTGPEKPVAFGRQVVVAGLAPAGTSSVTLLRVGAGESGRTVKARPDGSFTVLFRAEQPGAFRAVAGKGRSPLVRVRVVPEVTVSRAGSRLRVTAAPARPGARIALQEYVRDYFAWRTVARARLGRSSRASIPIPPGRPARLRVVVRGQRGWADGASPAIVLAR
jgi:plastocyanin